MTILYIDDDADDCFIMAEALKNLDAKIECITFTKSVDGLRFLMETDKLPDFVILDINMPSMNGKECLLAIKKEKKLKGIPVVMCSTAFQTKEMKTYFELGAYDFIVKPNSLQEFHVALSSIISSRPADKK